MSAQPKTVISNMRGRSIIGQSKDLLVNVNGNAQVTATDTLPLVTNTSLLPMSEQSTHRMSNEKLPEEADLKDEVVLRSSIDPYTPHVQ